MGVTSGADETPMPTHLTKRNGVYYFRRVIPETLRLAFGNRRELTFSLRTKDFAEACKRCRAAAVKSDHDLDAARGTVASPMPVPTYSAPKAPIDRQSYAAAAFSALQRERDKAFSEGRLPAFDAERRENLEVYQAMLDGGDNLGLSLAQVEGLQRATQALLTGEGATKLASVEIKRREHKQVVAKPDTLLLLDLVDKWSAERNPAARSVDMWRRTCGMFEAVVGQKPVGTISKADVLAFRSHLVAKGNAVATVDSRLNHLRSLFRFAIEHDIIETDPAASVRAPVAARRAKEARLPFDATALKAIFTSPIYVEGARPNRGAGEAAYWLPLLALYTGARLNEMGQLRPKDVVQEVYLDAEDVEQRAWVIRIVEDERDALTLKNASSNRRVPIHQVLIDLGFLRLVDAARNSGQSRIFPDLKPDRYGVVTGNWSKWFSAHLRKTCGVIDPRMTFHSFRHNFKHHARACGLDRAVNDAFTGHESGGEGERYGYLEYPLLPMVDGMARYRVPGFSPPSPPASLR